MTDRSTTDDSNAVITGAQREELATIMRLIRHGTSPLAEEVTRRLCVLILALYDQLTDTEPA